MSRPALNTPLPAVLDVESARIPAGLPPVIDAHVHLFPARLFGAVWKWFEKHGWPIRHKTDSQGLLAFMFSRGVHGIVGLHYAHKPGIARDLNRYMADRCREYPGLIGTATVFPGEPEAADILRQGFAMGLCGVKLHSHVQCFALDSPDMEPIYRVCARYQAPLIMHVGREPKSPAYPCDPYQLCQAEKLEAVIGSYPDLKVCVPHLGADEFEPYRRLIERYDNLWLDTSVALSRYLPLADQPVSLARYRSDRILYGTDFPNIPYGWDREIRMIARLGLSHDQLARILGKNARELFASCTKRAGAQGWEPMD